MKTPKVLFIDDEIELILDYSEILRLTGYEASVAINGDQCLRAIRNNSFDVVVLEPGMAGISGMNLLREIDPARVTSPEVIILTGFASVESGLEFLRNGAFDYLAKPVKTHEFLEKIRQARQRKLIKERALLGPPEWASPVYNCLKCNAVNGLPRASAAAV